LSEELVFDTVAFKLITTVSLSNKQLTS
jgi:hypothetical protein